MQIKFFHYRVINFLVNMESIQDNIIDVILGDPGAVSGSGEKSTRVRKKFGRRPV